MKISKRLLIVAGTVVGFGRLSVEKPISTKKQSIALKELVVGLDEGELTDLVLRSSDMFQEPKILRDIASCPSYGPPPKNLVRHGFVMNHGSVGSRSFARRRGA